MQDGNLHPLIIDGNDKDQLIKTEEFAEILKFVSNRWSNYWKHGWSWKKGTDVEMFNDNDIQQQLDIKKSLTKNLLNPGKVYPILRKEEEGRVHVHKNKNKFPDLQGSDNIYPKDEGRSQS